MEQILGSFVVGLGTDKPVEIQKVCAGSMVHALSFASGSFEDAKVAQRNLIMTAICNATQVPDMNVRGPRSAHALPFSACCVGHTGFGRRCLQVRLSAFDCIITVASLYYANIETYMSALFGVREIVWFFYFFLSSFCCCCLPRVIPRLFPDHDSKC